MVSTSNYILDIDKEDILKAEKIMNKFPASHFAIINKKSTHSVVRYELAISQKALFDLDEKLKKQDIKRKFTLI